MKTNELLKDAAGGNVREKVQKPFALCRELMRMYTSPGDIVLEMCCGTAPFAMAGLLEGRHVLSLDVDKTVVELASARLVEAKKAMLAKLPAVKSALKKRKRRVNLTHQLPVANEFPAGVPRE